MAKFNKKLSPLVKRQLPQHIQANNPLLAEFIKQYYVFMDSAQITLSSVTASDQILLETAAEGFITLNGTDEKSRNAGDYILNEEGSIGEFQKGETITRNFTLIEGSTARELEKKLIDNPYLTGEFKNLKEGIYKPDTYFFKFGYPRKKLLAQMKKAQEKFLEVIWKEIPNDFILENKDQLLILASIIQKESSNINDSKLVASVFINRLKNKMKLQSDVTLAYGFKVNGTKITKKMLKSENPFNTYKFYGLPPTPISYPGEVALNSLKNLKITNYLYFVSDGNGRHRFSKTYNLHKKNIELWKKYLNKDK